MCKYCSHVYLDELCFGCPLRAHSTYVMNQSGREPALSAYGTVPDGPTAPVQTTDYLLLSRIPLGPRNDDIAFFETNRSVFSEDVALLCQ